MGSARTHRNTVCLGLPGGGSPLWSNQRWDHWWDWLKSGADSEVRAPTPRLRPCSWRNSPWQVQAGFGDRRALSGGPQASPPCVAAEVMRNDVLMGCGHSGHWHLTQGHLAGGWMGQHFGGRKQAWPESRSSVESQKGKLSKRRVEGSRSGSLGHWEPRSREWLGFAREPGNPKSKRQQLLL